MYFVQGCLLFGWASSKINNIYKLIIKDNNNDNDNDDSNTYISIMIIMTVIVG